jgi:hypothetical protein
MVGRRCFHTVKLSYPGKEHEVALVVAIYWMKRNICTTGTVMYCGPTNAHPAKADIGRRRSMESDPTTRLTIGSLIDLKFGWFMDALFRYWYDSRPPLPNVRNHSCVTEPDYWLWWTEINDARTPRFIR